MKQSTLTVFTSFLSITGGLGLMNSIGIYQSWISSHQLSHLPPEKIAWIFGLYNFLVFFCGIQIGPIFDVHGPRALICLGSAILVLVFVCIGFCQVYWHFMLVIGLLGGLGTSFIFIVPVATIGHYYEKNRGAATGLAMSGGSIGGILFPLILLYLAPQLGFDWATRIVGLITLVLLVPACIVLRVDHDQTGSSPSKSSARSVLPDLTILKSPILALTTLGVFFIEWGFFIPLEYISSYALAHHLSPHLASLLVVFLNAGSFFGRWIPGILADRIGRFNTLILTNVVCLIAVLGLWMPADGNGSGNGMVGLTVVFAVVFGFGSGSNISLVPVCVGELCDTGDYGRFYTTVYTVVSLGALTGVPIAGEIISRCDGAYWGLIAFAGCSYAAGLTCFIIVKILQLKLYTK